MSGENLKQRIAALPNRKCYEWTDKDLHRNISAGSSAGGQQQIKDFYLKYTLRKGRKHCNDRFIFSFTNWLEKVQSIVQVTACLFSLPHFYCTESRMTKFPCSATEMSFSWKGQFRGSWINLHTKPLTSENRAATTTAAGETVELFPFLWPNTENVILPPSFYRP